MSDKKVLIDSTLEDQSLSNYDLLKIAYNNKWISETELTIMAELDSIFSSTDLEDYFADLEYILMRDEIDIDPQFLNTDLTSLYIEYSIKYLKNMGIMVDEDYATRLGLYNLSLFIKAVNLLNSVPEDLALTLLGILQEKANYSNKELLFNLINTVEPNITIEMFFEMIEDVYPNFFNVLESNINKIVKDMNLEGNEDTMDVNTERVGNVVTNLLNVLNDTLKNEKLFLKEGNTKYKLCENVFSFMLLPIDFLKIIKNFNNDFFNTEYTETIKRLNIALERYKDRTPIEKLPVLFYNLSCLLVISMYSGLLENNFIEQDIKTKVKSDGVKVFTMLELNNIDRIIDLYVNEIMEIFKKSGYIDFVKQMMNKLNIGADNE